MVNSQLSASKDVLVTSIYCKNLPVFALYCWLYLDLLERSCIHAFPFVWTRCDLLRMRQRVVEGAAVYDIFSVCYGVDVEILSVS
jgi:hypothetical protein